MLRRLRPNKHSECEVRRCAVIMVGIAFGRDAKKQGAGDVLVATEIVSYEQQRVGKEVVHRATIPPSDPTLLNRFENALAWSFRRPDGSECVCRPGPILSGEKLIDDVQFKAALFAAFPQAIGGEMEGAGLCAAAIRGVPWILVKAVCDWADGNKNKEHQPLAAASAASLVQYVLAKPTVLNGLEKQVNRRSDGYHPESVGLVARLEFVGPSGVEHRDLEGSSFPSDVRQARASCSKTKSFPDSTRGSSRLRQVFV